MAEGEVTQTQAQETPAQETPAQEQDVHTQEAGAQTSDSLTPPQEPAAALERGIKDLGTVSDRVAAWAGDRRFVDMASVADALIGEMDGMVRVPGADATEEEVEAFKVAAGRPEKPEDYQFEYPKDFTPDPATEAFGKQFFHSLGLNAKQAQEGVEQWNRFVAETRAGQARGAQELNQREMSVLREDLGESFNQAIKQGRDAVEALGLPDADLAKITSRLGDAAVMRLMAAIGSKAYGSGDFPGSTSRGGEVSNLSEGEVISAIESLKMDKNFLEAYYNGKAPGHNASVTKFSRLVARGLEVGLTQSQMRLGA